MSTNQDSRKPDEGMWPLQHTDFDRAGGPLGPWSVDMRSSRLAWRIKGRDDGNGGLGQWLYDPDSAGDIHGGQLFNIPRGSGRGIPMWRFATPSVISSIAGQQTAVVTGPGGGDIATGGTGRFLPVFDDLYNPDGRFVEITHNRPSRGGKEMWPKFPVDYFGISLTANYEPRQIDLFMPTDPRLIAVNRMGNTEFGSLVCDIGQGDKIDLDRMARLQSMMRVLVNTTLCSGGAQKVIAWNVGPSGLGDTRGGYMFEARGGSGGTPTGGSDANNNPYIPINTNFNPFDLTSGFQNFSPSAFGQQEGGGGSGAADAKQGNGGGNQFGGNLPPLVFKGGGGAGGNNPTGNNQISGQGGKLVLGIGGQPLNIDGFGFGKSGGFASPGGGFVPFMGGKGAKVDGFGFGAQYGFIFPDGKVAPITGGSGTQIDGFGFGARWGWKFPPDPPYRKPFADPKIKSNGPGKGVQGQGNPVIDPDIDLIGYSQGSLLSTMFDAPSISPATQVKNATGIVAMMSQFDSGLMEVGMVGDKHTLGRDGDGHEIHASHISTNAYFYQTQGRDAPLEFGGRYPRPPQGPYPVKAHIAYDPMPQHPFACGPRQGLWRLYSYCFFEEKKPPKAPPDVPTGVPRRNGGDGGGPPVETGTPGGGGGGGISTGTTGGGGGGSNGGNKPPIPGTGLLEMSIPSGYYGGSGGGTGGGKGGSGEENPPHAIPNPSAPLTDVASFWEKYYRTKGYPYPPSQPANMTQWMPGWTESYAGTSRTVGVPAIVGTPQNQHANSPDLRRMSGPIPRGLVEQSNRSTPVTGRIEAFGSQQGCSYNYTQAPAGAGGGGPTKGGSGGGRFGGGTSNGGFALMPPEFDILDARSSFSRPNVVTPSTTYFVAVPGAYFGAGVPQISDGGVKSGYRWGTNAAGDLVFSRMGSTGTATEVIKFDSAGIATLPATSVIKMGSSTGTARVKSLADLSDVNTNNSGSGETDFTSYVFPANSFALTLGSVAHITAWGSCTNNANAKTLRVKFGGTTVMTYSGFAVNVEHHWKVDAHITKVSTNNNFEAMVTLISQPSSGTTEVYAQETSGFTQSWTADITAKLTGQGTSSGDITQNCMVTEFYN